MTTQIIFEGFGYTASVHKIKNTWVGLIVTGRKGGKMLQYPACIEWIDAIESAIDPNEARELCKAIYNA